MPDFRKIATTGLISLTLAVASVATITPAFARGGGGGHEGGMHQGDVGGGHFDRGSPSVNASSRYDNHFNGRFRDHRPIFFGNDDDYDPCDHYAGIGPFGHRLQPEVCD
jgi:hypothetical protein